MIITVSDKRLPDDQNDGLRFDTSDTHAVAIRDEDEYHGVRVTLGAQLATARMRFHVDVNVGDPIWPNPETVQFPRLHEIRWLGNDRQHFRDHRRDAWFHEKVPAGGQLRVPTPCSSCRAGA